MGGIPVINQGKWSRLYEAEAGGPGPSCQASRELLRVRCADEIFLAPHPHTHQELMGRGEHSIHVFYLLRTGSL